MLSAHEQQVLTSIGQHFHREDPALYARLQRGPGPARARRRSLMGGSIAAFGAFMIALGIVVLSMSLIVFGCLAASVGWVAILLSREDPERREGRPPTWGHWA